MPCSLNRPLDISCSGAKTRYNLRVVETLVAARILALRLKLTIPSLVSPQNKPFTLREVLSAYLGVDEYQVGTLDPPTLSAGLEKILHEVEVLRPDNLGVRKEHLDSGIPDLQLGLSMEEMIQASGLPNDEFHNAFLSWVDGQSVQAQCEVSFL